MPEQRERKPLREIVRPKQLDALGYPNDLQRRRMELIGTFPKRFKIGSEKRMGSIGYWLDEILAWQRAREQQPIASTEPTPKPEPKAKKKAKGKKPKRAVDVALMP